MTTPCPYRASVVGAGGRRRTVWKHGCPESVGCWHNSRQQALRCKNHHHQTEAAWLWANLFRAVGLEAHYQLRGGGMTRAEYWRDLAG